MTYANFRQFCESKKKEKTYDAEPKVPKAGKLPKNQDGPAGTLGKDAVVWQVPDGGSKGLGDAKEPNFSDRGKVMPYGKSPYHAKVKAPKGKGKKLTTENFLQKTKNMSDSEFAQYLLRNVKSPRDTISSLYGEEFVPEPSQTMQYVIETAIQNPLMMTRLVREMRRNGGLGALLEALLEIPAVRKYLAEAVGGPLGHMKKKHHELPPPDMDHGTDDIGMDGHHDDAEPGPEDDPDSMNLDGSMDDETPPDEGPETDDDEDGDMDHDDDDMGPDHDEDDLDLDGDEEEDSHFSDEDFPHHHGFKA